MIKSIDLPYSYNSLEPNISRLTVSVHYNKHYQSYINKLNDLLKASEIEVIDINWIFKNIDKFPFKLRDDILYNAMAVGNHNLYWLSMSHINSKPVGKLYQQIEKQYGSFNNFIEEFKKIAMFLVGSGYTFLVKDKKGELTIMNMSNQDSPYVYGYKPILTIDLWEHSYYLDYLNDRTQYINNFFSIINFDLASKLYEENYS